jgi:hypothetical protein
MLGSWIKRKVQLAGIKGAREDLERFVESLRGQSDKEIGAVVAMAAVVRVALRQSGLLPDELLQVTEDPQQSMAQLAVAKAARRYQGEKRYEEANGAMVWLHSLRALSTPEVRHLGRQMWRQLERGQLHALKVLQDMGIPSLSDVTAECSRIPGDLDPIELRD